MTARTPFTIDYSHGFDASTDERNIFDTLFSANSAFRVRHDDFIEQLRAQVSPHFALPFRSDDLQDILDLADDLRAGSTDIVFFGTGGSSLCGQAFAQLNGYGLSTARLSPRLHFYDNLDVDRFSQLLDHYDLATTRFVIISKSGGTAETLLQARLILQHFGHRGLSKLVPSQVVGITEPHRAGHHNGLRTLLSYYGARVFDHDPGLGGRYTAFSIVGLLPAALAGLDISALRRGARLIVDACLHAEAKDSPVLMAVLWHLHHLGHGRDTSVFMGYGDRFERLGAWFVQLWAESLGKDGQGFVPLRALGPVDQHSQMQLFLDGPDKFSFSIVSVEALSQDPRLKLISEEPAGLGQTPFDGLALAQFAHAQVAGAVAAISGRGRGVRHIRLPQLDEMTLGALMMQLMLETILCGRFLDINPYDQPAVEEVKTASLKHLTASLQP